MKTSKINRAAPAPPALLEHYCRGSGWLAAIVDGTGKRSAAGREAGGLLPALSECLAASDLSPKTIQKHVDNLWALGGEIIRHLHQDPSLRKKNMEQILDDQDRRRRRPASLRPGIGGTAAAVLRFQLQEALSVP